jgi:hypothetical protein
MAAIIRPGLRFCVDIIPQPPQGLGPTMSTYGYGWDLEGAPCKNSVYIICKDGSVQSIFDPERPIGWELFENDAGFFFRVSQMNHQPQPCLVYARGYEEYPPAGTGKIGSTVTVCRRLFPEPQNAEISEATDDGEEVTSCPGAPKKEQLQKIRKFNATLATCAEIVNDPVQTEALARFSEGKMSYAEMRGLCG